MARNMLEAPAMAEGRRPTTHGSAKRGAPAPAPPSPTQPGPPPNVAAARRRAAAGDTLTPGHAELIEEPLKLRDAARRVLNATPQILLALEHAPGCPGELVRQGGRGWIPCRRCLGAIREVTP